MVDSDKPVLDFEKLLAPISESNPAGEDLRQDSNAPLLELKELAKLSRKADRPLPPPPKGESSETQVTKWSEISEKAQSILTERSKDLTVTALLIEALFRQYGFRGLLDGFRLARKLVEEYWDQLYPLPDEEGLSTKVAGIAGLNGSVSTDGVLIFPIRKAHITEKSTTDAFTYAQYESSKNAVKTSDLDKITAAATATKREFYSELRNNLDQAIDEYSQLSTLFTEKCKKDAPPSSQILGALEDFRKAVYILSNEANEVDKDIPESNDVDDNKDHINTVDQPSGVGKKPTSREAAFQTLESVADYFNRNEPHSPLSYLLKQAVRWGRMPLPELMAELIADEKVRETYSKLTGVRIDSDP